MFGAEGNGRAAQASGALERHVAPTTETKLDEIALSKVKLGRGRRTDADRELNESITRSGILQPLLLRPAGSGFEVLDGGRRLAVARELGLKTVPAVVRTIGDSEARAMAADRKATPAGAARKERKPAATTARPMRGARAATTAGAAGASAAASAARPRAAAPISAPPAAAKPRSRAAARAAAATPAGRMKPVVAPQPKPIAKRDAAKPRAVAPRAAAEPKRAAKAKPATTPKVPDRAGVAASPAKAAKKSPGRVTSKPAARVAALTAAPEIAAAAATAAPAGNERLSARERIAALAAAQAPVEEKRVVFGDADDTVELRKPSIAAAAETAEIATPDETMIWRRPIDEPAARRTEETAISRRPEPAVAPATTSFPRSDPGVERRPVAAATGRPGAVAAQPSRSRDYLSTACMMVAFFALAFGGTMFFVFQDGGTALLAGVVLVIALGLFAAVSLTGRRTGP
jgi:ParB-like chromosome segregation protein Spo0J